MALGISGVETQEYAWASTKSEHRAQIDLLIDRKDGIINLCEMKFSNEPYEITGDEYEKLQNRLFSFQKGNEHGKSRPYNTGVCQRDKEKQIRRYCSKHSYRRRLIYIKSSSNQFFSIE